MSHNVGQEGPRCLLRQGGRLLPRRRINLLFALLLGLPVVLSRLGAEPAAPMDLAVQKHVDTLIGELRSDRTRFNARRACEQLLAIGRPAVGPLKGVLDAEDHQQRHMAADVLIHLGHGWRDDPVRVQPTPAMLRVVVEGLRNDTLPVGEAVDELRDSFTFNARHGTEYLIDHIDLAEPLLAEALGSEDGQQQFLAACLLGWAGRTDYTDRIVAILLPHLRDNDLVSDALLAAPALYRLGERARPYLEAAVPQADAQQRRILELILLDMRDPPTDIIKLRDRQRRYRLTGTCYDPVYQFNTAALHQYPFDWPRGMPHIPVP